MAPTSPTGTKRFTQFAAAGDAEGLGGAVLAVGMALAVGVAAAETGGTCTGTGARRASTANPTTTDPATTAAVRIASATALSGRPRRRDSSCRCEPARVALSRNDFRIRVSASAPGAEDSMSRCNLSRTRGSMWSSVISVLRSGARLGARSRRAGPETSPRRSSSPRSARHRRRTDRGNSAAPARCGLASRAVEARCVSRGCLQWRLLDQHARQEPSRSDRDVEPVSNVHGATHGTDWRRSRRTTAGDRYRAAGCDGYAKLSGPPPAPHLRLLTGPKGLRTPYRALDGVMAPVRPQTARSRRQELPQGCRPSCGVATPPPVRSTTSHSNTGATAEKGRPRRDRSRAACSQTSADHTQAGARPRAPWIGTPIATRSPIATLSLPEPMGRFELPTNRLQGGCSTPELHRLGSRILPWGLLKVAQISAAAVMSNSV